jgi:hypothetical protein
VEVFNLRRALRKYYRSEGATDLVTITVPKGGYRASFLLSEVPPSAILDDPERRCGQVEWSLLRASAEDISRLRCHVQHAIERWPGRPDLYVALASTALAALELECVPPMDGVGLMRCAADAAVQLDGTRGDAHFYAGIHEIFSSHKDATINVLASHVLLQRRRRVRCEERRGRRARPRVLGGGLRLLLPRAWPSRLMGSRSTPLDILT